LGPLAQQLQLENFSLGFGLSTLAWAFVCGTVNLETLAWELWFGTSRLGYFAWDHFGWDFSLGTFRLGSLCLGFSREIFRLGFAWGPSLGNLGLGELPACAGGMGKSFEVCCIIKKLGENPS